MIKETSQVSTRTSRAQRVLWLCRIYGKLHGDKTLWLTALRVTSSLEQQFEQSRNSPLWFPKKSIAFFVFKILIYVNGWLCTCGEMFTWLFDTIGGNDSTSSGPRAQTQMGSKYVRSIRKTCVVKFVWTGTRNTVYGLYLCLRLVWRNNFFLCRNELSESGLIKASFWSDSLYRSAWGCSGFIT